MPGRTVAHLAGLISGTILGDASLTVVDVTHDSRTAGTGVLYVAVPGMVHDGHEFVGDAVNAGSEVVCVNRILETTATQIVVDDPRAVMGPLASAVHDDPSRTVPVIGVTGTNGKTTVTHFIESIAASSGMTVGLIGTIRSSVGSTVFGTSSRTTPEACDFQRLLAQMRDAGAELIATEVSSHALSLRRVNGTRFSVAAFTNLSQDHLDFHHDMGSYRVAKESLFRDYDVARAVLNINDPVGRDIASWAKMPVTTVGSGGDFDAVDLVAEGSGTSFDLHARGSATHIESALIGQFNIEDLVMAAACCAALDIDMSSVIEGVRHVTGVPGRFELVSGSLPVRVVVDYAHSPAGIRAAVGAGRRITTGKLLVVMGAGGDRDTVKRPLMGTAAGLADLVVVTNDNPRSEDPRAIADAVMSGIPAGTQRIIELDRRAAIGLAVGEAGPGDLVLILGKGHETGQERGGIIEPFSDRDVVQDLLGLSDDSTDASSFTGGMAR